MNRLIPAALALALGLSATAPVRAAETILFNCFFPPQHYMCKEFLGEMKRRVETATEDRVRIRIPPNSLAAPPDQYDGVVKGVMDGALQMNAFIAGKVPGIQFSLLPFVGRLEAGPSSQALWETYQTFFGDRNEYGEVVLISVYAANGAEFFSMTDTPITSIEDLSRRKMWAVPGTAANVVKETGSSVVAGPAVQMLEIISKGVVDGYTGVPVSSVYEFKLADYTKSVTVFPKKIFQPTFSFFVSRKKWDNISAADQAAILNALGGDFARWMGDRQDEYQQKFTDDLRATGTPFIDGDPAMLAALEAIGQPMIDAWIARAAEMGVDGRAVLEHYSKAFEAAKGTN